ncbi:MAG: hypothetical protein EOO92_10055 [Pedobacter sp.]|nr:MAG: hypothetical protein EOO92_10055 [Pedobacter sp.]
MCSLTPKQQLLIGFLAENKLPLGAEDIFLGLKNAGAKVSYSGVYENLNLLFNLGLIIRSVLGPKGKFGYCHANEISNHI